MLDPDARSLYTDALRPPPGFRFDQALATTYSLDLSTLLTVPLHLVLFSGEADPKLLLKDSIALLEALRRSAARLGIYCQQGQIHVPDAGRTLFSLLEPVVVEARAPGGGAFHPKLWVLRFLPPGDGEPPLLRLLVLSRNITMDRSWDLALQLEGRPGRSGRPENQELRELVAALPRLAARPVPARLSGQAALLSDELHRTEWEVPGGFEQVRFHVLGLGRREWLPAESHQLAVVSPFCTPAALARLAATTDEPVALVARPEELARLDADSLAAFGRCLVLDENAETEDGEEPAAPALHGLHAKAYIARKGWYTRVYVGSANATDAALLRGANVEVLAELVGKRKQAGDVGTLLDGDGFGAILVDHHVSEDMEPPDPARAEAERALGDARKALGEARMRLLCGPGAGPADRTERRASANAPADPAVTGRLDSGAGADDEAWRMTLVPPFPVALDGVRSARAWPVTLREEAAVDALPLAEGRGISFPVVSLAAVVGFVAFELEAEAAPGRVRFVLNLPVDGLPEARDAAVVRSIVQDRDGFLRYLLLLLGELDGPAGDAGLLRAIERWRRAYGISRFDALPLLEEMTRALCRDPNRLAGVRRLIEDLRAADGPGVVPPEFLDLWRIFESALEEAQVARRPD